MTDEYAVLYKKTSRGGVQAWKIGVRAEADGTATIVTEYGQHGGQMQVAEVRVTAGKNTNKANATTPVSQAHAEALAKWKKQQDKGYVLALDAEKLAAAVERKPMLAQDYHKHKKKVTFPCHIQPKLDGMRCLAHMDGAGEVSLISRGNKSIANVPHVNEALKTLMTPGEVWDGELYRHGMPFQALISLVKRHQPGSEQVQYHVYDCITDGDFADRFMPVSSRIHGNDVVRPVRVQSCENDAEVKAYHNAFVFDGYEGAMVRANGCPYKEGYRSYDLLKAKLWQEEDFPIVAIREGIGKDAGTAIFTCETKEGARFDCKPRGTDQVRRGYFENKEDLIGKLASVVFFEWTTSDPPLPRFPSAKAVRDYE